MTQPAVSVVVRTFNRTGSLPRTLAAVASQHRDDLEVIVVNDAGVDPSHVVTAFADRLDIRLVTHASHQGPGAAANTGLAEASGRWVLLCDDDDTIDPAHLNELMAAATRAPGAVAVYSHAVVVSENDAGSVTGADPLYADMSRFSIENQLASNAVLFDRAAAIEAGGFRTDMRAYEDWEMWLRLATVGELRPSGTLGARHHRREGYKRRRAAASLHIIEDFRRVYAAHPAEDGHVELLRATLLTQLLHSDLSAPMFEHSFLIHGHGDVSMLLATLSSVIELVSGTSYEVLISEQRAGAVEELALALDGESIVFGDGDGSRLGWLAAGRNLTELRAGELLVLDPDAGEFPLTGREMHERALVRAAAEHVVALEPTATPLSTLQLEYSMVSQPRWGYGRPSHRRIAEVIEAQRPVYRELLEQFVTYADELARVSLEVTNDVTAPYWNNDFFKGLDALGLYGMLRTTKPERYVEIGSGISTRWARRAIEDGSLSTRITSIDPYPRAQTELVCDEVIRRPLENTDPATFASLGAGDILFFDGSHRTLTNSDVTVFFLEVLPEVPSGVMVHIHDIFWPWDYPPQWAERFYSEQYLLGMKLMERTPTIETVLPTSFIAKDAELSAITLPMWSRPELASARAGWGSFWFRVL